MRSISGCLLIVVPLVGCMQGPPPPTVEESCVSYAAVYCAKLGECDPPAMSAAFGDVARCTDRTKLECTVGAAAPNGTSTGVTLGNCAIAYNNLTCPDIFLRKVPTECVPSSGPLAVGTPCGDNSQCQTGFCNRKSPTSQCGICAARGGDGASCSVDDECQAEYQCTNNHCKKIGVKDQACGDDAPCMRTLACINGTCVDAPKQGAMCDIINDNCDPTKSLFCDIGSDKVCTATATANAGEPCGFSNGQRFTCNHSVCRNTGLLMNSCEAYAADGAACDASTGPACEAPARCEVNKCVLPHPQSC